MPKRRLHITVTDDGQHVQLDVIRMELIGETYVQTEKLREAILSFPEDDGAQWQRDMLVALLERA